MNAEVTSKTDRYQVRIRFDGRSYKWLIIDTELRQTADQSGYDYRNASAAQIAGQKKALRMNKTA